MGRAAWSPDFRQDASPRCGLPSIPVPQWGSGGGGSATDQEGFLEGVALKLSLDGHKAFQSYVRVTGPPSPWKSM